jgi:hypothetical protein
MNKCIHGRKQLNIKEAEEAQEEHGSIPVNKNTRYASTNSVNSIMVVKVHFCDTQYTVRFQVLQPT